MSMAAGARAGARVLQHLRSPTPFFSRAQLVPHSSPSPSASSLTPSSRGFSADHHGPARVNIWEAPTDPARWKEEHFVFVSLAGWFSLFFAGYKAATGQSKPKLPAKVELPPKAGKKSDPVHEKAPEKSVSRKEESIAKTSEKPAHKKKEEKAVSQKEEEVPPSRRKGERPVPKNEGDVPKRWGERPSPKTGDDVAKRKAELPPPKKNEEKKPEPKNPKDKKRGFKLVKVDDEVNAQPA